MWCYLEKSVGDVPWELSRKDCERYGIKKDSYYRGVEDLISYGFLEDIGGNRYKFHENGKAVGTEIDEETGELIYNF